MAGIEYTEPFLDQERFFRFYETLFTSSKLDYNKRIFLSTLNTTFTPSSQGDEYALSEHMNGTSNPFYQRAWSWLRSETIFW